MKLLWHYLSKIILKLNTFLVCLELKSVYRKDIALLWILRELELESSKKTRQVLQNPAPPAKNKDCSFL